MFIKDLYNMYDRWQRERNTIKELNRLTDKELSDIGIHRASIPFIARKRV